MSKLLALDVETGGLGPDKSLLSAYFVLLDENFNTLDELSLFIKPDDGVYKVTAGALGVNKINLVEHDALAMTNREAGTRLYEFLEKNNPGGAEKFEPLGHNVAFDINFIKAHIISEGTWLKYVSYRLEDTGVVGNFLKRTKFIPKEISGGLRSYAEFFGVTDESAHTAKGDVDVTVAVYQGMMNLVNGNLK